MKITKIALLFYLLFCVGCTKSINQNSGLPATYNIIQPQNGIYVILKKGVSKKELLDNFYEKIISENNKPIKIERFDKVGKLTDELSTSAITKFEYNSDGKVHYVKYYNKHSKPAPDKTFGFASIEYIYDELGRVRMEIYRDENFKFLKIPKDEKGNFAKVDFLSPVLTYEYLDNGIKIKALDQNFNLLKEVIGEKPCVPFIDCGNFE
jgi:hypothetical protein